MFPTSASTGTMPGRLLGFLGGEAPTSKAPNSQVGFNQWNCHKFSESNLDNFFLSKGSCPQNLTPSFFLRHQHDSHSLLLFKGVSLLLV